MADRPERFNRPGGNRPNNRPSREREERVEEEFEERVVEIDRVSRTVKGGKRMRFRALVVIGNKKGKVGMGVGKAGDVQSSIQKAVNQAKKHLIDVPIVNDTIPHETTHKYGSAVVFLKPAAAGTSIIAGGPVRAVIELAGIRNILSKIIGSSNKINNVRATLETLASLKVAKE
ncbi:MAG: 30S ribosomal protein S5 [Patescibacteria group bacterium]|jgi:small subunit ribosomal protein S5